MISAIIDDRGSYTKIRGPLVSKNKRNKDDCHDITNLIDVAFEDRKNGRVGKLYCHLLGKYNIQLKRGFFH
jgi:hypothetical protein